jgi:predicted HNH restriction endonuclease
MDGKLSVVGCGEDHQGPRDQTQEGIEVRGERQSKLEERTQGRPQVISLGPFYFHTQKGNVIARERNSNLNGKELLAHGPSHKICELTFSHFF